MLLYGKKLKQWIFQKLSLMLWYGKREEGKTMAASETSVVYDIKVGGCSQLNEYMKL